MINPGMMISDRYEILDKVGSGGMADVYKAKCHRLNRFVAIKILKQEYSNDAKFVSKFRAEAQSVAELSHPNIVNVYDVGEDQGLYYIVMELVEGITLKRFISEKTKLSVEETLAIAMQIAQGMQAAHDHHIIHRDIKPQNIIISREGKVKVTDFGIAKAATSNTITSNAMGSVHYISPEQARGGYSDEKSDIYSLGVTMYEMLSGSVPFEGDSTISVALAHIQSEATPLDQLDPDIPVSLSKIIQKCMQKKPEMRYLSAEALIDDLKRALDEPDGNYVTIMATPVDGRTRIINKDELEQIKNGAHQIPDEYDSLEEPADEDAVDPKLEKIIKICSLVVAIILVIGVALIIIKFKMSGNNDKKEVKTTNQPVATQTVKPGQVVVPDITKKTLEEAEKTLTDKNLKWSLEAVESEETENTVTDQKPEAGSSADEYSRVTIYYSKGAGISIPDVQGKTSKDAMTAIEDAKLSVAGTKEEYSDTVDKGLVIGTDPVIGSSVSEDTAVTLILSKGPESDQVTVPNLVGKKEAVAREKLSDVGLKSSSSNISYVYSDSVVKGCVISQGKTAGSKVDVGTSVSFSVSLGSKSATPTPASAENYSYRGKVTISANPFASEDDDPAMIRIVLSQDGKKKTVWSGELSYGDFPKTFSIYGWSENNGTATLCKGSQEIEGSYDVEFTKVAK